MKREINKLEMLAIELMAKGVYKREDYSEVKDLITTVFKAGYTSGIGDGMRTIVSAVNDLVDESDK